MAVDPDFQIALGYLVVVRIVLGWVLFGNFYGLGWRPDPSVPCGGPAPAKWLVATLLLGPLIVFLGVDRGWELLASGVGQRAGLPRLGDFTQIWMPDTLRWLCLIPAVLGLLGLISAHRHLRHTAWRDPNVHDDGPLPTQPGPYRLLRYPDWTAELTFFGSLLVGTGNWLPVILGLCAVGLVRGRLIVEEESHRLARLGTRYADYAATSGWLLPLLPASKGADRPQYVVPPRFGVSAMIALVTMFALMFGILNGLRAQMAEFQVGLVAHVFFGTLLMLVWLAQMRFQRAARGVSVLVGALLLPVFVLATVNIRIQASTYGLLVVGCIFLGGLVGYCMGAMAAGVFLVTDWVERWRQRDELSLPEEASPHPH